MTVRPAHPGDVPGIVDLLAHAWRDTYRSLLPPALLEGRDPDEDARDVAAVLDAPDPSGATVVLTDREMVGFTTYGPPRDGAPDDLLEIYAMYVRGDMAVGGAGRRLLIAVVGHARRTGARHLRGFVHAGNAAIRNRIESRGVEPWAGPLRRQWLGHPVEVFEYRWEVSV